MRRWSLIRPRHPVPTRPRSRPCSCSASLEKRFATSLRVSGPCVTTTSLTTVAAFAIGTSAALPGVAYFCMFATSVFLFGWLFQVIAAFGWLCLASACFGLLRIASDRFGSLRIASHRFRMLPNASECF